jgi:hypothetical protein
MHILIESAQHADEIKGAPDQDPHKNLESNATKNIPLQVLNHKNFCLEIGIKLLLDFDDIVVPFRSTLVGIETGKYLILKAPGPIGRIDHDLFKVKEVIVKSLYKGTIYAFRSRLLHFVSKPSKLMFIAYPREIEHHELRSHKRFQCNIGAQSEMNEKEQPGVIKNISKGGCFFAFETLSTQKDFLYDLHNRTLSFKCCFPGSTREISFNGEIRNTRKNSEEVGVGIKFIYPDITDEVKNIIHDYIELIEYSSRNV